MPRPKLDDKHITRLLKRHSPQEVADIMGISVSAVYKRRRSNTDQTLAELYTSFIQGQSLADLAWTHCTTIPTITRRLFRYAAQHYRDSTTKIKPARPRNPPEILIVHHLLRNPKLENNPPRLVRLTRLEEEIVDEYLEYNHDKRTAH